MLKNDNEANKPDYLDSQSICNNLIAFINSLAEIILGKDNRFKLEYIELSDSFKLVTEIISNLKLVCSSHKDNKKVLLLELFQSYFLNENTFKQFLKKHINDFSNILNNYYHDSALTLESNKFDEIEKNNKAKQFKDLFSRIQVECFFVNCGLKLLEKNGYTKENLLKYMMLILTYQKDFYYDLNIMIACMNELTYENLIEKLDSFMEKFDTVKYKNKNLQLIYKENCLDFIPVDIDILTNIICYDENYIFPQTLKMKINKYNKEKIEKINNEEKENEQKEKLEKEEQKKQKQEEEKEKEKQENIKPKAVSPKMKIIPKKDDNIIKELLTRMETLESKLDETRFELEHITSQLEETKEETSKLKSELKETKDKFNKNELNYQSIIEVYEDELEKNKNRSVKTKKELDNLHLIINSQNQKITALNCEVKELKKENNEINSFIMSIKCRDLYKTILYKNS